MLALCAHHCLADEDARRGEGFVGVFPDLAVLAAYGLVLGALALRTIGERA